jgi:hypothetical protein
MIGHQQNKRKSDPRGQKEGTEAVAQEKSDDKENRKKHKRFGHKPMCGMVLFS